MPTSVCVHVSKIRSRSSCLTQQWVSRGHFKKKVWSESPLSTEIPDAHRKGALYSTGIKKGSRPLFLSALQMDILTCIHIHLQEFTHIFIHLYLYQYHSCILSKRFQNELTIFSIYLWICPCIGLRRRSAFPYDTFLLQFQSIPLLSGVLC